LNRCCRRERAVS